MLRSRNCSPRNKGRRKQDHEKKQSIFHQIKAALKVHATIEEEIFYPAVKKARRKR